MQCPSDTSEETGGGTCYILFSSEIGCEIKRSQKLIVDYREELKKSRVIRRHRQEYDAMAKVMLTLPFWFTAAYYPS